MAITACTEQDEYVIYTGSTATPHAIFIDENGEESIQCNTVELGGNGIYN